jgi:hypothetical protein
MEEGEREQFEQKTMGIKRYERKDAEVEIHKKRTLS